jgi:hypothetical protein
MLETVWTFLVGKLGTLLPDISPFWGYGLKGLGVIAAAWVIAWFFPSSRPLAGALALGVFGWLWGYRKAEEDAEAKAEKQRKAAEQQQQNWPPTFPWSR